MKPKKLFETNRKKVIFCFLSMRWRCGAVPPSSSSIRHTHERTETLFRPLPRIQSPLRCGVGSAIHQEWRRRRFRREKAAAHCIVVRGCSPCGMAARISFADTASAPQMHTFDQQTLQDVALACVEGRTASLNKRQPLTHMPQPELMHPRRSEAARALNEALNSHGSFRYRGRARFKRRQAC